MNKQVFLRWFWIMALMGLAACSGKQPTASLPLPSPSPSMTSTLPPTQAFTATPLPPTRSPSPIPMVTVTPKPTTETYTDETAIYFVSETIPDGSQIAPGQAFTKSWKIGNSGPGTWTTDFDLFLVSSNPENEHLGAPDSTPLSQEVKPDEEIEISIDLIAPAQDGQYTVVWRLRNERGEWILGSDLWVIIRVGTSATGSVAVEPSVTATLVGASQADREVSVAFCMQMPDSRAWYPWDVTLIIDQQSLSPSGSLIDPATATGVNKCFTFSYPSDKTIPSGVSYQLSVGNIGLPPEVHQAENCAYAWQVLTATYPGLDFTCAGPGFWYTGLVTPPGMTAEQADRLILDAMSSTIYGPWDLYGTLP